MPGFFKFDERAALEFAEMCASFTDERSKAKRIRMAAWCLSQVYTGKDTPCFNVGYRQIADACGVSVKAARKFIESATRDGWIVDLGPAKGRGTFQRRTFSWLLNDGEVCPNWGTPYAPSQLVGVGAYPYALNPPSKGTHQNTEYSDRARALHSHYAPAPREVEPRPVAPPIEDGAMPWE